MPQDVCALRSFLGLTGFSLDFVEKYALIAKLLYYLLKKDVEWTWGEPHQEAFIKLKKALASSQALAYPKEGILQLATTPEGMSTILLQDMGIGPRPIEYGSQNLSEVKKQLTPCE